MAKTYGDKPVSFQLEENGEFWCIGSEVFKSSACIKSVRFSVMFSEEESIVSLIRHVTLRQGNVQA